MFNLDSIHFEKPQREIKWHLLPFVVSTFVEALT